MDWKALGIKCAYAVVPLLLTAVATWANTQPPTNALARLLANIFAWNTGPGRTGLLGSKLSLPGLPSWKKNGVNPNLLLPWLVLGALFAAGCCKQQTKACVVANQVLSCTGSEATSLAPAILAAIKAAFASGAPDWNALLAQLTSAGIKDGICVLMDLMNDFVSQAATASGIEHPLLKSFHDWLPGVKLSKAPRK